MARREHACVMRGAELLFRNICITKCFIACHAGAREREKNETARAFVTVPLSAALHTEMALGPFAFDPGSTQHEKCIRRIPPLQRAEINIPIVRRHVIDFINWQSNGTAVDERPTSIDPRKSVNPDRAAALGSTHRSKITNFRWFGYNVFFLALLFAPRFFYVCLMGARHQIGARWSHVWLMSEFVACADWSLVNAWGAIVAAKR